MRKSKKIPWWEEERSAWTPPEPLTVSQAADKYRMLSRGPKPGQWQTAYIPFMREVMDSFGEDSIEEIWFCKCAQIGGTEAILNMLLYSVIQDPGPTLVVQPNEAAAVEFSDERLEEMIESSDTLKSYLRTDKEQTKRRKFFRNMDIYFAWSGSPTSLARRAIRYVFFDEVNKYEKYSGEEASPLALGKERALRFAYNKKLIYVSTPTVENGYISEGEKTCEARFRLFINCPQCHKKIQLIFSKETVIFPEDHKDLEVVRTQTYYQCQECKGRIYDYQRMELVRRARWFDIVSGLEYEECIKKRKAKRIGFQVNRLYDPIVSFGMVAVEFLASKDDAKNLMNFKNSWLAEEWVERIFEKKEDDILVHRVDLPSLAVPPGAVALTAGIDPGQGGFWFTVWAWIPKEMVFDVHLVQYGFLTDWSLVKQIILDGTFKDADGRMFPVWRGGIDTAGGEYESDNQTMTESAYNFLRQFGGNRLFGTKGISTSRSGKRMQVTIIDKMPKLNKPIPGGITLWLISTDEFKDSLHYRLQVKQGDPGGITLNKDTADDFAKHILAEEKRKNRKGETEWVVVSKNNHLLDCTILALAMGDPECWGGVRVLSRPQAHIPQVIRPPEPEKVLTIDDLKMPKQDKAESWIGDKKGWL